MYTNYFWVLLQKKEIGKKRKREGEKEENRKKEKKKIHRQINCLVYPYNRRINYILSKPDKQKHFFTVISLWEGQDSCSPLVICSIESFIHIF